MSRFIPKFTYVYFNKIAPPPSHGLAPCGGHYISAFQLKLDSPLEIVICSFKKRCAIFNILDKSKRGKRLLCLSNIAEYL